MKTQDKDFQVLLWQILFLPPCFQDIVEKKGIETVKNQPNAFFFFFFTIKYNIIDNVTENT